MLRPRAIKPSDRTLRNCNSRVMVGIAKHRPNPNDLKLRGVEHLYQRRTVIRLMPKPFPTRRIGINPARSALVSIWSGPNWQERKATQPYEER